MTTIAKRDSFIFRDRPLPREVAYVILDYHLQEAGVTIRSFLYMVCAMLIGTALSEWSLGANWQQWTYTQGWAVIVLLLWEWRGRLWAIETEQSWRERRRTNELRS